MKVYTIVFGFLVACVASLAAENGPLLAALQPQDEAELREVVVLEPQYRQKRFLGTAALGLGALGLGAAGIGAAGLVGAGLIGAKAGLIGGALVGGALARGHGGYGGYYRPSYGRSYGGYGGYGYGGGYGGYRTYIIEDSWC